METEFAVHPVDWTREKCSRWWDAYAARPGFQAQYFTRMVGRAIVDYLESSGIRLGGRVIDFGCGPGYLLQVLASRGIPCEGADFSPQSLQATQDRLAGQPFFRGVQLIDEMPTRFETAAFDALFLIETVEHILDDELDQAVAELQRIIKPQGLIIVTTPNDEDLEQSKSLCPDCGCVFHRVQHVRSWSRDKLAGFMCRHGFETLRCETANFKSNWLRQKLAGMWAKMLGKKFPHLIYVGRKPGR